MAPPEAEFSRKVAFITGGAGGIGSETARLFVEQGAHVVLADLNLEGAEKVAEEINNEFGEGRAFPVKVDVTNEEMVMEAYQATALQYGGVDIIVNNAGLATSSPFDETSLKEWNLNMNVLGTGYFLVAREAFKLMKEQGIGGSMVFVGSKNSVYAGKNATAYSAVKALEAHLARCIAAEGGAVWHSREYRLARRYPARLRHLEFLLAQRTGSCLRDRAGSARRILPQTHDAACQHLSAGRCGRHRLLRFFQGREDNRLHVDG